MDVLTQALQYAARGWRVFPCKPRDKRPLIQSWQTAATTDEETILGWWTRWPDANCAVVMGQESGMLDFETDSPDEEADFAKLFGGPENLPYCPSFRSTRGRHWLFKWSDALPPQAVVKYGKLCVRTGGGGKGAYSIFPPSTHPTGARYAWIEGLDPDSVPLPEVPQDVNTRLWNESGEELPKPGTNGRNGKPAKSPEEWERIANGVGEGARNQTAAEYCGAMMGAIDAFNEHSVAMIWQAIRGWNTSNRPPLEDAELRRTFESILQRERTSRINAPAAAKCLDSAAHDPKTGDVVGNDWRLEIQESVPPVFLLYSPLWVESVLLNEDEMFAPLEICKRVLSQKFVPLDKRWFALFWDGDARKQIAGHFRPLVQAARILPAPPEIKRPLVVLTALAEQLQGARAIEDGKGPDTLGRPSLMPDGSIWFIFNYVWKPLLKGEDKITKTEMSAALLGLGASVRWSGSGAGRRRYQVVDKQGQQRLEELIGGLGAGQSHEHVTYAGDNTQNPKALCSSDSSPQVYTGTAFNIDHEF